MTCRGPTSQVRRRRSAVAFAVTSGLVLNACSGDSSSKGSRDAGADGATAESGAPEPNPGAPDASRPRTPDAAPPARTKDGAAPERDTGGAHVPDAAPSDASMDAAPPEGGVQDASPGADASRARSLWNGVDLSEWEGDPMIWKVVDGAIVGNAPSGYLTVNSFLIYRGQTPADFVLTADAWLSMGGNSGIQYRSMRFDTMGYRIRGYQADLGLNYWGQLDDEAGRGILKGPSAGCLAEAGFGKWLAYEVRAVGPNLAHRIDGVDCMSYVDTAANRPLNGVVALQYHVPGGFEVRFKNLRLEAL